MDDLKTTARVKQALDLFCIDLHDHIIISNNSYYSMREHGNF